MTTSSAQLRLPLIIGDGMVLQRDVQIPLWGWADPGQKINVTRGADSLSTESDAEGQWKVTLPAMPAGTSPDLTVSAGEEVVVISDILVGDVWICSGQSNMEWPVIASKDAEQEIAAAVDTQIRHFKVPRSWSWSPEPSLAGGSWEAADPETVGEFTAVGYFFARTIREDIDVPIGLINTSWGGSRIEPWMSAATLGFEGDSASVIRSREEAREGRIKEDLLALIGELPAEDRGYRDGEALWAQASYDDAAWDTLHVPGMWEQGGYVGMDGIGWYRTTFELTAMEAESELVLGLGMIDDSDIAWVNGVEVGRTEMAWNQPRIYRADAPILRPGRNTIAIRVEDTGGGGGIHGDPGLLYLEHAGTRRSLAGAWRFAVGAISVAMESQKNQVATVLYNKMIYPLLDYPIKGALWYQGESNAGLDDAGVYRTLFSDMISQWRSDWGVGSFPFLFVQLANWEAGEDDPSASGWAVLRESQTAALSLPNTAQAVTIDIGEAGDIHPRNKQDVGRRLALAARKIAYGEDIVYSGPVYAGSETREGRVFLEFDHVGSGLVLRDHAEGMSGFEVAGDESVFVPANVRLDGQTIVAWSEAVENPKVVRYAWADNPIGVTLYNAEGLPATPFRTSAW
jgi:sialate O-acetylesterase